MVSLPIAFASSQAQHRRAEPSLTACCAVPYAERSMRFERTYSDSRANLAEAKNRNVNPHFKNQEFVVYLIDYRLCVFRTSERWR